MSLFVVGAQMNAILLILKPGHGGSASTLECWSKSKCAGAAGRSKSAPHMHVLVCMCGGGGGLLAPLQCGSASPFFSSSPLPCAWSRERECAPPFSLAAHPARVRNTVRKWLHQTNSTASRPDNACNLSYWMDCRCRCRALTVDWVAYVGVFSLSCAAG